MEGSLEAHMLTAAILRRKGDMEGAENVFIECLKYYKEKEDKVLYTSAIIKYSRFVNYVSDFQNKSQTQWS